MATTDVTVTESARATDAQYVAIPYPSGVGLVLYPRAWVPQDFVETPYGTPVLTVFSDASDATYVANTAAAASFRVTFEPVLLPAGAPHRITGVSLLIRALGTGTAQPTIRVNGREDVGTAQAFAVGYAWYVLHYPVSPFSGRRWTAAELRATDFSFGFATSGDVRVSELRLSVAVEPMPYRTVPLNEPGSAGLDWTTVPATASAPQAVAEDTGDLSYVQGENSAPILLRTDEPPALPDELQIDRVVLHWRGKGGSVGAHVHDVSTVEGPAGRWTVVQPTIYQSAYVPFTYRPAFTGPVRWTPEMVAGAEWGLTTLAGEPRVSYAALELFASLRPEGIVRLAPTGGGTFNEWTIVAPNAGEAAWEDVNSYLPNDASYLRADATVSAKLITFEVLQSTEANWYGLRWRARLRTTPGYVGVSVVHPVLRISGRVYVGRPFQVTSSAFLELAEDFWLNPTIGKPWRSTDLLNFQLGLALASGKLDCSWCLADVGYVPPREAEAEAMVCTFTTVGEAHVARSISDSLVWVVDQYQVGKGGYQADNPAVVRPVEPADASLEQPIWTGTVAKAVKNGWSATYYCAVPPDVISDPIGEVMLWARIVSSNNPSDVVGTRFPLAVGHFPAGFHTRRSIRVLALTVNYPPLTVFGPEERATAADEVVVVVS